MLLLKVLLGTLIFFTFSVSSVVGDTTETEIKVAYVYNFLKFVYWPNEVFESKHSPFQICTLGASQIYPVLAKLSTKQAHQRSIEVFSIKSANKSKHCHLIYIGIESQFHLVKALAQVQQKGVLTVSDIPDFALHGGMIGFIRQRRKIKLEINLSIVRSLQLQISSNLLELATIVR